MKYLSFDIEATGLEEDDLIIEFGMVPFCTEEMEIHTPLQKNFHIKCPSFDQLRPRLTDWVIEHNKELIVKSHREGLEMSEFKAELETYLTSAPVRAYFGLEQGQHIVLFGKSMSSIDLPFLNRDLGWDFMRRHFHHRNLDLSSAVTGYIDMGILPLESASGTELMNFLGMGGVAHTALEDAVNTADIYLRLLEMFRDKTSASV